MKKFLLGTAALMTLGMASQALAADLGARTYTKAPPMLAAVYDWTGFYVGASGGYGEGRSRFLFTGAAANTNHDIDGGFGGGQIGYNWQSGGWVFGIEGDAHAAEIRGRTLCPNPAFTCGSDVRTLATLRGRLGYATNSVLFYGTGGGAYVDTRYTATSPAGPNFAFSTDRWGYAAGAGIEWGFAPSWSAKVEYMHYGIDRFTAPIGALSAVTTTSLRPDLDTVKIGINYRWGGPVVARY